MESKSAREEAKELGIHLTNACAVIDPNFDWDKQKIHLDRLIEHATKALETREKKGREEMVQELRDSEANSSYSPSITAYDNRKDGFKAGLKLAVEKVKYHHDSKATRCICSDDIAKEIEAEIKE